MGIFILRVSVITVNNLKAKMKHLTTLLLTLLVLGGCVSQPYVILGENLKVKSYFDKASPKALVSTSEKVWVPTILSTGRIMRTERVDNFFAKGNQSNMEFSIVGAFHVCEKEHSIELCDLKRIGDFEANETEKIYWKQWYKDNKDSYQFGYKFNKLTRFSGYHYYSSEDLLVRYSDKPFQLKKRKPKVTI